MMRYGHMDLKKGNYFPLPNCIFQLGLSPPEIAIYAYLMRREDRESYQCRVPFKTIGAAVGIKSKDTVMKYVHRLEEKGLIYTEPTSYVTTTGLPANGSLLYTIRPIQEAKENYQQKLMEENEKEFARMKLRQAEEKDSA